MLSIDGVNLASLNEAISRSPDQWFLIHHRSSNQWVSVRADGAWKEMASREYDDWRGPFDSVVIVRRKNADMKETKSRVINFVQDKEFYDRIASLKERFSI